MTPEPFPGLNLSYHQLVVVVLLLILIEVGLWLRRSRAYAVAIWLPVIVLTTAACSGIVGLFLDSASLRTGLGDMSGLGFIIDFVLLGPWIIAFSGAIFCHPLFRQQSLKGWVVGNLISVVMIVGLVMHGKITEETKFIVLDSDGNPISNQTVSVLSSHYSDPHIASSVVTNRDGTFTLWLTPGKSIFLNIVHGSLSANVRLWNQEDFPPSNRTVLNTYCDWDTPGNPRWGIYPVSFVIGQKAPVPLILKSHTNLTSPYVRELVRTGLMQARDGASPLNLTQLISNPEALEQLDLISEVMAKQPSTRAALIQGLQWSGQLVISLNSAANPYIQERGFDAIRCLYVQWFNLTPNTVPRPSDAMTPAFRQKVDALSLQIISTVKPYLGTDPGASGVIREMGVAGRPAIPDFAQAFPTATKQCQDQMLNSLWALKPKVSDLGWLVESGDPRLVFAGYEAARDAIKPEERDLAKERVDEALTKTTTPGEISFGKTLSANIGRVSAGPIMDRGVVFAQKGDDADALAAFNQSIHLDPYTARAYVSRGIIYAKQGNDAKALEDFNQAIHVDPYSADAYVNRGVFYTQYNNDTKALADLNEGIRLDSNNADAYVSRGYGYNRQGDDVKALADFNHAVELDPKNARAYNAIAWFLATSAQANLRDGKKAVEDATKACELSAGQFSGALDTLAAAYAEAGDFDNAVKWENKFLETPNLNASDTADGKSRLALYQLHQPYRDVK